MTVTIAHSGAQHAINTSVATSSQTITFPNATTTGNLVCGFICADDHATGWNVTDPSNSYTVATVKGDCVADSQAVWGFYKVGVTGGQTVITITNTTSAAIGACIIEFNSTTGWTGFRSAVGGSNETTLSPLSCSGSIGVAGDTVVSATYLDPDSTGTVNDGVMTLIDFTTTSTALGTVATHCYVLSIAGAFIPSVAYGAGNVAKGAITAMAFTPASGAVPRDPILAWPIGRHA